MKVIKSIQVTWNWTGDADLITAFNVAVTPNTGDPNTELVVSTAVGKDPRSYTFKDVTLDDTVTYTAWVQAVYVGKDSDWISAGDLVVSDDGTASIATSDALEARATAAENTAASYTDTAIAGIDVSADIDDNNNLLAQKLGYVDYAALEAAAVAGNTVINGGYVNTDLIAAQSISADMLSAGEIITSTAQIGTGIITNAQIANGTITSANIALATITEANILDGTITAAKIGTAEIDTLRIGANAVTVPVGAFTAAGKAISETSYTTIQSVSSIDSSGQPIAITFSGLLYNTSEQGASRTMELYLRIIDDLGAVIYPETTVVTAGTTRFDGDVDSYRFMIKPSVSAVAVYTPTTGSRTVYVQGKCADVTGTTYVSARGLIALGLKR